LNPAAARARSIVDSRAVANSRSLNAAAASARAVRGQLRDAGILNPAAAHARSIVNSRAVSWSLNAAAASARAVRGQLRDAGILNPTSACAWTVASARANAGARAAHAEKVADVSRAWSAGPSTAWPIAADIPAPGTVARAAARSIGDTPTSRPITCTKIGSAWSRGWTAASNVRSSRPAGVSHGRTRHGSARTVPARASPSGIAHRRPRHGSAGTSASTQSR